MGRGIGEVRRRDERGLSDRTTAVGGESATVCDGDSALWYVMLSTNKVLRVCSPKFIGNPVRTRIWQKGIHSERLATPTARPTA